MSASAAETAASQSVAATAENGKGFSMVISPREMDRRATHAGRAAARTGAADATAAVVKARQLGDQARGIFSGGDGEWPSARSLAMSGLSAATASHTVDGACAVGIA